MIFKRSNPSFRSRSTKQSYSDLNPLTEAKLKRASSAKHHINAIMNFTRSRNKQPAETTHLNVCKYKVLSPIHQHNGRPTRRQVNPQDVIRKRTLHGSKSKTLPGILARERGFTTHNKINNEPVSYLNNYTTTKLQRSRSLRGDTDKHLEQHRSPAPSNSISLPQLNKSDNCNNRRRSPMKRRKSPLKVRKSADIDVSDKSKVSDKTRTQKSSSSLSSKVNNYIHLKQYTADDFRGYNDCLVNRREKHCENDSSFEQYEKLNDNIKQLECKSQPLGKWYPLPDIGKQGRPREQRRGRKVAYTLNKDNKDTARGEETTTFFSLNLEQERNDEIPIPKPDPKKQTYTYRYSSAGPCWSGKTKKEEEILQCRREVLEQNANSGEQDKPKDNLALYRCFQDPRYETTSLSECLRPYRWPAAVDNGPCYTRNHLLPMKRLHAPWKVTTEFGRYVTDTLHPRWRENARYNRRVEFFGVGKL